jgi:glycosyltransferase involved in cell wall biosynthesis
MLGALHRHPRAATRCIRLKRHAPDEPGAGHPHFPERSVRIVLIGDFEGKPDEAMRQISQLLHRSLAPHHAVTPVGAKAFCLMRAAGRVRAFRPDVLHYVTGPTMRSLMALKMHRLLVRRGCVTIATGLRPFLGPASRLALRFLRPDCLLAQARRWQRCFAAAGSRTFDWPNGVDCARFKPVGPADKAALRARWNIPSGKPCVLHVGHVKANRNLETLVPLQASGRYQVLVVGSQSQSELGPTRQVLEEAGCRVVTEYLPSLEQLYQAADFYVFTVRALPPGSFPAHSEQVGVIDFPLSILEAMACGLPVATTRHDAVEYFLKQTPGLAFFDGSGEDCLRQLRQLERVQPQTRAKAEQFDWPKVLAQLDGIYASLFPT